MTRDFELIRKLLAFFDEKPGPEIMTEVPHLGDEYSEQLIMKHLIMMYEAGFLICEVEQSSTSDRIIRVYPFDLTWEGHEFLAKVRSEDTWQKVKTLALSKGGSLSFSVLDEIATTLGLSATELR